MIKVVCDIRRPLSAVDEVHIHICRQLPIGVRLDNHYIITRRIGIFFVVSKPRIACGPLINDAGIREFHRFGRLKIYVLA
jgi:hypothetical protein